MATDVLFLFICEEVISVVLLFFSPEIPGYWINNVFESI